MEFFLTGLRNELKSQAPPLVKPLEKVREQLREAIRQARGIAHGLAPISLEDLGLKGALRKLSGMTRALTGARCEFVSNLNRPPPDASVATHFYRIAQEAVNNALKHGKAKKIRISLKKIGDALELKIRDNGRGFSGRPTASGGMGLRTMKYRADLIRAVLDVQSVPRKGTTITCTVGVRP